MMARISCFSFLLRRKTERSKVRSKVLCSKKATAGSECQKVKPVEFMNMADTVHVSEGGGDASPCDTNAFVHPAAAGSARQDRDANEDKGSSTRRDSSDAGEAEDPSSGYRSGDDGSEKAVMSAETPDAGESFVVGRMSPSGSPTELKRSCSNIETVRYLPAEEFDDLPVKSRSYGASHQNDSDTLDAVTAAAPARESRNKEVAAEAEPIPNQNHRVAFPSETASSMDRVSAWVNSLGNVSFHVVVDEEDVTVTERDYDDGAVRAWCSEEIVECSTAAAEKHTRAKRRTADEAVQANSMVQTLNAVSSVARISGMGLRAVPMIAAFSSLRAVDLSGNFIVDIYPGSLPKGLHSLDLSRNRIASIEGLRELTRLRVLNLSYNRISRIGHGLSSCTAIRELYLAGNRIGDVEGLHRLLKLAVLDVSFNKITTTKSLGHLVASYGSLRALNLLGNPVQANLGDDTLRKAVSGLLPRLEYLNKKAVKPHQRGRGREVAEDSVARGALGGSGRGARRRTSRRVSQSPGSPGKKSSGSSRSRSKTRAAQGSSPSSRR